MPIGQCPVTNLAACQKMQTSWNDFSAHAVPDQTHGHVLLPESIYTSRQIISLHVAVAQFQLYIRPNTTAHALAGPRPDDQPKRLVLGNLYHPAINVPCKGDRFIGVDAVTVDNDRRWRFSFVVGIKCIFVRSEERRVGKEG